MILFLLFFLFLVGMFFLMGKSDGFANAVGIVIGALVFIMLLAVVLASCS